MVLRRIETKIPTVEELSLPPIIKTLAMTKRGIIIFVGATGTGKSTSLAAMIGYRNQNSTGHIITIEDPIEFVHKHEGRIVRQREVGIDTDSVEAALKKVGGGLPAGRKLFAVPKGMVVVTCGEGAAVCPGGDVRGMCAALFGPEGFRGNRADYYDPANSLLDQVLARRTGIPITLSVLAMEVGRRVGAPLVGIGMPGHFLVPEAPDGSSFHDPFHRGPPPDPGRGQSRHRSRPLAHPEHPRRSRPARALRW